MNFSSSDRVLVTGGSGFIGTNLVDNLISQGVVVVNFDISPPRNKKHLSLWLKGDVRASSDIDGVLSSFKPTHIFHLGARTDLNSNDLSDYSANTDGVSNLIKSASKYPCIRRVVFASSRLVCRIGYNPKSMDDYCPTTTYGESKIVGEKILKDGKNLPFEWVVVRPTSIWGPWFDVPYRSFFDHVKNRRYIHPVGMVVNKSFGFVGNTVFQLNAIMNAPYHLIAERTFYLGDYSPIEVGDFSRKIACAFGVRPPLEMPMFFLGFVAKCGDFLNKLGYKNPPLTSFRLNNLISEMIHDFDSLPVITGELPYSVDDGIRATVTWMKEEMK